MIEVPGAAERQGVVRWVHERENHRSYLSAFMPADAARATSERVAALTGPGIVGCEGPKRVGSEVVLRWPDPAQNTLADALAHGPLAIADATTLLDELLLGLSAAHAAGFVHPELTTERVLVQTSATGVVGGGIVGFGAAAPVARQPRDDVRDLASIAYHMICGTPPDWTRGDPPPPSAIRQDATVPAKLEHVIMRGLGVGGPPYEADAMRAALNSAVTVRHSGTRPRTVTNPQMPRVTRTGPVTVDDLPLPISGDGGAARSEVAWPAPRRASWLWVVLALLAIGVGVVIVMLSRGSPDGRGEVIVARPTGPDAVSAPPEPVAVAPKPAIPADAVKAGAAAATSLPASSPASPPTEARTTEPTETPKPAPLVPVAPTPAPLPADVICHIKTTPAGAVVSRDGTRLGQTPLDLRLPRANLPVTLLVELAGHLPEERTIERSDATTIQLDLTLARRPAVPQAPRRPVGVRPPPEIVNER